MAITKYTGNGGIAAMFSKLKEVYNFKKVVCEGEDETAEDAVWDLWVSDELFIAYQGGSNNGWADMRTKNNVLVDPFIKNLTGSDLRTWTIIKTDSGVAFYVSDQCSPMFISDTINSAGATSAGFVGKTTSNEWRVYTDGLSNATQDPKVTNYTHGTYTQLENVLNPLNDWYFPNLFIEKWVTSTAEQIIDVDGTKYYSNCGIALKE